MAENRSNSLASNLVGGVKIPQVAQVASLQPQASVPAIQPQLNAVAQSSNVNQNSQISASPAIPISQIQNKQDRLDITTETPQQVQANLEQKPESIRKDYPNLKGESISEDNEVLTQPFVNNLPEQNQDTSSKSITSPNYNSYEQKAPNRTQSGSIILLISAALASFVIYLLTTGLI